jgi:hypothetical protein
MFALHTIPVSLSLQAFQRISMFAGLLGHVWISSRIHSRCRFANELYSKAFQEAGGMHLGAFLTTGYWTRQTGSK